MDDDDLELPSLAHNNKPRYVLPLELHLPACTCPTLPRQERLEAHGSAKPRLFVTSNTFCFFFFFFFSQIISSVVPHGRKCSPLLVALKAYAFQAYDPTSPKFTFIDQRGTRLRCKH